MTAMLRQGSAASNRILTALKQAGDALSVKKICHELDLSSMAVRRQLAILQGEHLVAAQREKRKTGRPSLLYYLTDEGHEEFPRDYSGLAIDVLVGLRSSHGKDTINEVLEIRRQELLREARRRVPGKTLEARVHDVSRLLTQMGYMARWERLGPGQYLIKEMNCAVARVAKRFPQVCIDEAGFLEDLLRAKVTRRHHILQKDHFCSYLVEESAEDSGP